MKHTEARTPKQRLRWFRRYFRQGGSCANGWRWYQHKVGACVNWRRHEHNDTEHLQRERFRATRSVGHRNARGVLHIGAIHSSGSLCVECAIRFEFPPQP